MKEATDPTDPLGTMPQEPWHPGKAAKPDRTDRVIQLNYGEVRTHASYKTTRTWENLNMGELKQVRKNNDPPFTKTMIKS